MQKVASEISFLRHVKVKSNTNFNIVTFTFDTFTVYLAILFFFRNRPLKMQI